MKSSRANIADDDRRDLADFGLLLLGRDEESVVTLLAGGELKELICDVET